MWCLNQFFGVIGRAANIGGDRGSYDKLLFREDYPQFFPGGAESIPGVPDSVLGAIIDQANGALSPGKWGEGWRYACGLYAAHYVTLYLQSVGSIGDSPTAGQIAAAGSVSGVVRRAQLGDSSVEYDTEAVTKALADWGDLNATVYGQQLATRAKIVGLGGMGVI